MTLLEELEALNAASLNGHEWMAYRDRLTRLIREIVTASATTSPNDRKARLQSARRVHDLLYVSQRIRKAAIENRLPISPDLLDLADRVLAKSNSQSTNKNRRSAQEEKYVIGAKVNWHKLLKRMPEPSFGDASDLVRNLRGHVRARLTELIQVIEQTATANPSRAFELNQLREPLRACLETYRDPIDTV